MLPEMSRDSLSFLVSHSLAPSHHLEIQRVSYKQLSRSTMCPLFSRSLSLSLSLSLSFSADVSLTTQTVGLSGAVFNITALHDDIAVEDGDKVTLQFNSSITGFVNEVEIRGEFIRHTAEVIIIDQDSK